MRHCRIFKVSRVTFSTKCSRCTVFATSMNTSFALSTVGTREPRKRFSLSFFWKMPVVQGDEAVINKLKSLVDVDQIGVKVIEEEALDVGLYTNKFVLAACLSRPPKTVKREPIEVRSKLFRFKDFSRLSFCLTPKKRRVARSKETSSQQFNVVVLKSNHHRGLMSRERRGVSHSRTTT